MKDEMTLLKCTAINKKHQGFVLIMVMLLLSILSLSAFVDIEKSQFSYKVNHARLAKIKARQISEDARLRAITKLDALLRANEIKIGNTDSVSSSDETENESLKRFTRMNQNNLKAEVYYKALPTQVLKNGVSLSQNMAYSSIGMGIGSQGSFSTYYELRAKGVSKNNGHDVFFWTASDYRFTP